MPTQLLPADHELRRLLADEVHARPAAHVSVPSVVSCVALHGAHHEEILARVRELAVVHAAEVPANTALHAILELGGGRLKWERHGEFVSLTIVRVLPGATLRSLDDFPSAFDMLPPGWLASLPGKLIVAADIAILAGPEDAPEFPLITRWFLADALASSRVLDEAAWVFTDFVLRTNGRTRWMVLDTHLGRAQAARIVQRIIEIEIYRMMALLAFPDARALFGELGKAEEQLAELTTTIADAHGGKDIDERKLLDDLTRMSAERENSVVRTLFRFSSSLAYWEIVKSRVTELREKRIGDMRTLNGFLSRRLAPAMDTVRAASRRQEELSNRIERASSLLRTRVEIAREEQNQELLAAIDRRAEIQLQLQQTVEGLSIAAITYYVTSLLTHAVKPFEHFLHVDAEVVGALGIPIVAFVLWRSSKRLRAALSRLDG